MKLNLDNGEKLTIQLIIAIVLVLAGIVLLYISLFCPPIGAIDPTVLASFAEISTFAGALIGIDGSYRIKAKKLDMQGGTGAAKD